MTKDKKKSSQHKLFNISSSLKAVVYLCVAFCVGLSLWSFRYDQLCTQNWIGLLGWSLSSFLLYNLGLTAFLVPIFFVWLSCCTIKQMPDPQLKKKIVAFACLLISISILLSMLSPLSVSYASRFFFGKLPEITNGQQSLEVYLGGIPFYLICNDQIFGLKRLIGVVGTTLTSCIVVFSSLFYLCGVTKLFKKKNFLEFVKKINSFLWARCKKCLNVFNNQQQYLPQPTLIPSNLSELEKKHSVSHKQSFPTNLAVPIQHEDDNSIPQPLHTPHPKACISSSDTPNTPKTNFVQPAPSSCQLFHLPKTNSNKPNLSHLSTVEQNVSALPQYHLLSKNEERRPESLREELQKKAVCLKQTLASFGIEANVGNICFGPTLAAFEVHPPTGVKVQKIKTLEHDIALNLQASSIRIIAPIPGKAAVGIEIPNPHPQPVNFRDLLEDYQKQNKKLHVPLLLGKKANGDNFWLDLTTMPHLIIAGTTGSGKSVCINTIVMSLIMTSLPSEVKLVIIDPKKVELTGYSQLPHMLTPVITESREAHNALVWLVKEMELRYEILSFLGLRNIQSFNSRKRDKNAEAAYDKEIPEKMHFIVGIIDELSDLLLSSSQDIETPIIRLAQMARAVGIHLILATQRPSRDVITGLIKANFPSRIAFKVANKVNSQIIIDEPGAENLMGNGDMLVVSPASFGTTRAQGAYICDEDINKVVKDICSRFVTKYIISSFDTYETSLQDDTFEKDVLFNQAQALVLQTGTASTTFLQRKLKIGYARAASLIDQLEQAHIVGPSEGAKPRQVFQKPTQEH